MCYSLYVVALENNFFSDVAFVIPVHTIDNQWKYSNDIFSFM